LGYKSSKDYLQMPNDKLNENEIVGRHVVGFGAQGFVYPPVVQDVGGGV